MACNAEISTSTQPTPSHKNETRFSANHKRFARDLGHTCMGHKNPNRRRPISNQIPNPKPRTQSGNGGRDPNQRTISALIGKKENKESGMGKFGFGGLGCASLSPVSAPEVIRTAADWDVRKKKKARRRKKAVAARDGLISADVCCGPGIGFAADAALVDCVDSRRPAGLRSGHRQRAASARLPMRYEDVPIIDYGTAFSNMVEQPEVSGMSSGRQIHRLHCRNLRGLSETLMLETSPSFERSFSSHDRFGGWRLDVDRMSYEELLALGDRIGYVGTGLREEEIQRCIRKTNHSVLESLPLLLPDNKDFGCSICQEGFDGEDEIGKLECNHFYHMQCIKQWLLRKNACPVCKKTAAAAHT